MSMATRLKWFLDSRGVDYEILPHPRTTSALETAEAAHILGERMAKTVLLEDERGYVMAILPATHRIALESLREQLRRDLELASEAEIGDLFADCELGAIPPLGAAYGIPTVIDDSLLNLPSVYFEAGDHREVVRVPGAAFLGLLRGSRHGHFSRHLEGPH